MSGHPRCLQICLCCLSHHNRRGLPVDGTMLLFYFFLLSPNLTLPKMHELQDDELLKSEKSPSRLRVGEKKVLQQIDDIFKELDGLEYYQERRLKDLDLVSYNGDIIFWES
jgi:hypothetical protein